MVTDVSFSIHPGETIGIVGESGCGKTTLGRCIARAYQATSGEVWYRTMEGKEVDFLKVEKDEMKKIRKEAAARGGCIVLLLSQQSQSGGFWQDGHASMTGEIYTY